jgi:hypothetical protein
MVTWCLLRAGDPDVTRYMDANWLIECEYEYMSGMLYLIYLEERFPIVPIVFYTYITLQLFLSDKKRRFAVVFAS